MQLRKNWKNPIKFSPVIISFLLVGCSTYTASVRPSFDDNYPKKQTSPNSPARPSYIQKVNERYTEPKEETTAPSPAPQETNSAPTIPNSRGGQYQKAAEQYIGTPYRYGGTTNRGFDCSGFVWRVYQDAGHTDFSRQTAQTMFDKSKPVSQNSLREGDLIFFRSPQNRKQINHVGIYIGDEKFIHSATTLGVAYSKIDDTYWSKYFAGFKRILP